MKMIKLMPDYGCFPLWEASSEAIGNIDPDTLPLSAPLKSALADWAAQYDATLNSDDPLRSGFSLETEEVAFEQSGHNLLAMLQNELGEEYEVSLMV
jgi:hypothetical protein